MKNRPLRKYKVLELTHYIAGPLCGQILCDFGAEVLKLEPPEGDTSRDAYPTKNGSSAYFAAVNRGKKFEKLDLKSEEGLEKFLGYVSEFDCVITNYASGVSDRLGIGFEALKKHNPKLVYTQISGFGGGDNAISRPAYDGVIQAMSGMSHLTGTPEGPPTKGGLFVADHLSAWVAATGTLIALDAAVSSGEAQFVDISMLDSMFSINHFNVSLAEDFHETPTRSGNRSTNVFCTTYPTKDGWIYIAPITPKMWSKLCELIGKPEYAREEGGYSTNESRLENYDFLEAEVGLWTKSKTTEEIEEQLSKNRIAFGEVQDINTAANSKIIQDRNMVIKTEIDGEVFSVPANPIKINS